MSGLWRTFLGLHRCRRLQIAILIVACLVPFEIMVQECVAFFNQESARPWPRAEISYLQRRLWVISIFPAAVVFTNSTYLYDREVTLHLNDDESVVMPESELIAKSYAMPHRMAGVLLWHFFKQSIFMSDRDIQRAMNVFFCEDAGALDLVDSSRKVQAYDYGFRLASLNESERKVSGQCVHP